MSTPVSTTTAAPAANTNTTRENVLKGTLLSLLAIPAGIILWVTIWRMGFIASIVAFAVVWLAAKLYGWGAGTVTRKNVWIIAVVSIIGVVLAFFGGMASDMADYLVEETGIGLGELVTEGAFWSLFWENITTNGELWKDYRGDLIMSVIFAGLGMFWTLKDLFIGTLVAPASAPENEKTESK